MLSSSLMRRIASRTVISSSRGNLIPLPFPAISTISSPTLVSPSLQYRSYSTAGPEETTPQREIYQPAAHVVRDFPKVKELADQIVRLNLLELVELTKVLQSALGVPDHLLGFNSIGGGAPAPVAAAPAAGAAPAAAAAAAPAAPAEKTDYTIRLTKLADNAKYKIIKELREIKPSLSLMETKTLTEKLPSTVAEKVPKAEAEKMIAKLKAAGGEAEMV